MYDLLSCFAVFCDAFVRTLRLQSRFTAARHPDFRGITGLTAEAALGAGQGPRPGRATPGRRGRGWAGSRPGRKPPTDKSDLSGSSEGVAGTRAPFDPSSGVAVAVWAA